MLGKQLESYPSPEQFLQQLQESRVPADVIGEVPVLELKLLIPHPCKCSGPGWMGLGVTWSLPMAGVGNEVVLRHFPTQTILGLL